MLPLNCVSYFVLRHNLSRVIIFYRFAPSSRTVQRSALITGSRPPMTARRSSSHQRAEKTKTARLEERPRHWWAPVPGDGLICHTRSIRRPPSAPFAGPEVSNNNRQGGARKKAAAPPGSASPSAGPGSIALRAALLKRLQCSSSSQIETDWIPVAPSHAFASRNCGLFA